jgi:hypothetical protein
LNLLELPLRVSRCIKLSLGAGVRPASDGDADDIRSSESCESPTEVAVAMERPSRDSRDADGELSSASE